MERTLFELLFINGILSEREKVFDNLPNHRFDIWIENMNTIIECQGSQHWDDRVYCTGNKFKYGSVDEQIIKDIEKIEYCHTRNMLFTDEYIL